MSDEELGTEEVQETPEAEEAVEAETVEPETEPEPVEPEVESGTVEEPPLAESAAAVVPTPAPAAFESEPVTGMPPHRQTGLLVVVGSIALILILALVFWQPMFDSLTKLTAGKTGTTTETLSPAKAKVTATIGFVEAYLDQDAARLKPFLSDEAQAAGSAAGWAAVASDTVPVGYKFTAPVWSSDTTAALTFTVFDASAGVDQTGTLQFGVAQTDPLAVTMLFDAGGSVGAYTFTVAEGGSTWRVKSMSGPGFEEVYDAKWVQSIVPTATAQ